MADWNGFPRDRSPEVHRSLHKYSTLQLILLRELGAGELVVDHLLILLLPKLIVHSQYIQTHTMLASTATLNLQQQSFCLTAFNCLSCMQEVPVSSRTWIEPYFPVVEKYRKLIDEDERSRRGIEITHFCGVKDCRGRRHGAELWWNCRAYMYSKTCKISQHRSLS